MVAAYARRLNDDDVEAQLAAAKAWAIWEGETITLLPDPDFSATFRDGHFALAFARLENHYFTNRAWLREGHLLAEAGRLEGIPGTTGGTTCRARPATPSRCTKRGPKPSSTSSRAPGTRGPNPASSTG